MRTVESGRLVLLSRLMAGTSLRTSFEAMGGRAIAGAFVAAGVFVGGAAVSSSVLAGVDDLNCTVGSCLVERHEQRTDITTGQANTYGTAREFDTRGGHGIDIYQPSPGSKFAVRIYGGPGIYQGRMRSLVGTADGAAVKGGHVVLINPNGIIAHDGAVFDVGSLTMTTTGVNVDRFDRDGVLEFDAATEDLSATIDVREGAEIAVSDGGFAALVAPGVRNSGTIVARLGKVVLAGGEEEVATLDLYGDGLVTFQITDRALRGVPLDRDGNPLPAVVTNAGRIATEGGQVLLTARAIDSVVDNLINLGGEVEATSFAQIGGEIVLAGEGGLVELDGKLSAVGDDAGEDGGSIAVSGDRVSVGAAAAVSADAAISGDGGSVEIVSTQRTEIAGSVTARGGVASGAGGRVATGSGGELAVSRAADASARDGGSPGGVWELAAAGVRIADDGGAGAAAGESTIAGAAVADGLAKGQEVRIAATGASGPDGGLPDGGEPGGLGDLTVIDAIETGNAEAFRAVDAALRLDAARDVWVDADGRVAAADGSLDFVATAGRDAVLAGTVDAGGGDVRVAADRDVTLDGRIASAGGDVALTADADGSRDGAGGLGDGGRTDGGIAWLGETAAIDASNLREGVGGGVDVTGDYAGMASGARIDVRGADGGGAVRFGGGFQGKDADIANARRAYIGSQATILADATGAGDGGRVIAWADEYMRFDGTIGVTGGALGGDGGFVEVSGKQSLEFTGFADAGAAHGAPGEILLDPATIAIVSGANNSQGQAPQVAGDGRIAFADAPTDIAIANGTLEALVGSIALQADNNITVDAPLNLSGVTDGESFTLETGAAGPRPNRIDINANITTNGGNVFMRTRGSVAFTNASVVTTGGDVTINSGDDISIFSGATPTRFRTDSGNIDIRSRGGSIEAPVGADFSVNTTGGNVSLHAPAGNISFPSTVKIDSGGDLVMNAGDRMTIDRGLGGGHVRANGDIELSGANWVTLSAGGGGLDVQAGGGVSIDTLANLILTGNTEIRSTGGGQIELSAGRDLILTRVVTTNTGSDAILLTARTGAIVDGGDVGGFDIEAGGGAGGVHMTAATGIGDRGGPGGGNAAIELQVANLSANNTRSGTIAVSDPDRIVIRNVRQNAGGAAVTISAPDTAIDGDLVTRGSSVSLESLEILGDSVIDTTSGGSAATGADVTFNGAVDGGFNLNVTAGDSLAIFNDAVGGATPLANLNVQSSGATLGGNVTVTGDAELIADTTLAADVAFAAGGDVTLFGTMAGGGNSLTVMATTLNTNGSLGTRSSPSRLKAIDIQAAVNLSGSTEMWTIGGDIVFNGTIDGPNDLAVDAGPSRARFEGAIGGATPIGGLSVTAGGGIHLTGETTIVSTGRQLFQGLVTLDLATFNSGNADIDFNGWVNSATGAGALDVTAGTGNVTFSGDLGTGLGLGDITVSAAAATFQRNAANISAGGNIDFSGVATTTVNANARFDAAGSIQFGDLSDEVAHRHDLTLRAGTTLETGNIGAPPRLNPFRSVNLTGTGIEVDKVATSLGQTYSAPGSASGTFRANGDLTASGAGNIDIQSALTLGNSIAIASGSGGRVGFGSTIAGGGNNLEIDARGLSNVAFSGAVTGVGDLSVTGGVIQAIAGIATTGDQSYSASIRLETGSTLNAGGQLQIVAPLRLVGDAILKAGTNLALRGGVDGAFNLNATAANDLSVRGAVGGIAALLNLDLMATSGDLSVPNGVITAGSQNLTAGGNLTVGGGVASGSALTSGMAQNFRAGTDLTLSGVLNSNGSLVTVSSGNMTTVTQAVTSDVGGLSIEGAGETVFRKAVAVGGLGITSAAGTVANFTGAVATTADGGIAMTGETILNGNVTADGPIDLSGQTTIMSSLTIETTDDNITLDAVEPGGPGIGLTVNTDRGRGPHQSFVDLTGPIGAVTPFQTVTAFQDRLTVSGGSVVTEGDQLYDSTVLRAANPTFTSNNGTVTIRGNILMSGLFTVAAPLNLNGNLVCEIGPCDVGITVPGANDFSVEGIVHGDALGFHGNNVRNVDISVGTGDIRIGADGIAAIGDVNLTVRTMGDIAIGGVSADGSIDVNIADGILTGNLHADGKILVEVSNGGISLDDVFSGDTEVSIVSGGDLTLKQLVVPAGLANIAYDGTADIDGIQVEDLEIAAGGPGMFDGSVGLNPGGDDVLNQFLFLNDRITLNGAAESQLIFNGCAGASDCTPTFINLKVLDVSEVLATFDTPPSFAPKLNLEIFKIVDVVFEKEEPQEFEWSNGGNEELWF